MENNKHKLKPIDPHTRLTIAKWDESASRGDVTEFCNVAGISRATFYRIKNRALEEGLDAALEPKSRAPKKSPKKTSQKIVDEVIDIRLGLEAAGKDCGPRSVQDRMEALGMQSPGVTTLAKIFRENNISKEEPKKRPRSAYRRFVYPRPNDCWQLDGTEYVLASGQKCCILQLEDDHSRLAVASLAASGETSAAAIEVFDKAVEKHGVPQRLLSDNGTAFNPTRRGFTGKFVEHLESLGVTAMTGRPGKPTTQGKNERFHQTLFRYLDKKPIAKTLEELQGFIDEFDDWYNNERKHQGHKPRQIPAIVYAAVTKAPEPPRPDKKEQIPTTAISPRENEHTEHGMRTTKVRKGGVIRVKKVEYSLGSHWTGKLAYVQKNTDNLAFFDENFTEIARFNWAKPGTNYVGLKHKL